MHQSSSGRNAEYTDNRISLFSAQWGKCAVTGREFICTAEIHCHHKNPRANGGGDKYENLVLVLEPVHRLIHATQPETIAVLLSELSLDKEQQAKVNNLREKAHLKPIVTTTTALKSSNVRLNKLTTDTN
jgi:hypothetical protein